MHVLIAEDDRVTGEILARTLQRWNYTTTLVSDGAQAWERLRVATDPTLAVLDWMMPEMDGPDVCRRVRQELPLANMYLLLVTARESRGDMVAGLDAGADDYIIKPFDPEELRARVAVGTRVLGLQQKLAERVEELQTALSNVKQLRGLLHLQLLQAHPRRRSVLAASGRVRRGTFRRPVQPRHLPAVLREGLGRDRRAVAQQAAPRLVSRGAGLRGLRGAASLVAQVFRLAWRRTSVLRQPTLHGENSGHVFNFSVAQAFDLSVWHVMHAFGTFSCSVADGGMNLNV